jgi:nucleotide-binding universal stress UspA family protein
LITDPVHAVPAASACDSITRRVSVPVENHRAFRHILMPTDGSDRSARAIDQGMQFARQVGAKVTGFHAIGEYKTFSGTAELLEMTSVEYAAWVTRQATAILDVIVKEAARLGVECEAQSVFNDIPHEAILAAAARGHCDLVVMASHARRGLKGMLIGSETQKVMTHGSIPVLVIR